MLWGYGTHEANRSFWKTRAKHPSDLKGRRNQALFYSPHRRVGVSAVHLRYLKPERIIVTACQKPRTNKETPKHQIKQVVGCTVRTYSKPMFTSYSFLDFRELSENVCFYPGTRCTSIWKLYQISLCQPRRLTRSVPGGALWVPLGDLIHHLVEIPNTHSTGFLFTSCKTSYKNPFNIYY